MLFRSALKFALPAAVCLALVTGCDKKSANREKHEPNRPDPPPLQVTTHGGALAKERADLAAEARALPESGKEDLDGLEAQAWTVDPLGNPGRVEGVALRGEKHKESQRLALELLGGEKEVTTFRCEGAWHLSTGKQARTELVVYNGSGGALRIGLAYSVTEQFIWYESTPRTIKSGWNRLAFEQGASDFKTESSEWRHTAALWKPEACRAVSLAVYGGKRTGKLFVEFLGLALEK